VNRILDDEAHIPTRAYNDPRRAYEDPEPAEREISLGTPTILGIFFVLALVCACFFGFGYTLGRKSTPAAPPVVAATPIVGIAPAKPAAGSPASISSAQQANSSDFVSSEPSESARTVTLPTTPAKPAISPADSRIVGDKIPAAPQPVAAAASAAAGTFMVQVAAVSTQDIADIEVAALKKDGYAVVIRHEPTDKLLHVQIGPFTDKKAAEAMRQRVLADGFNAIVK
jgi:DedD protein